MERLQPLVGGAVAVTVRVDTGQRRTVYVDRQQASGAGIENLISAYVAQLAPEPTFNDWG